MATIPKEELDKLDAAELAQAQQADEASMADLVDELPIQTPDGREIVPDEDEEEEERKAQEAREAAEKQKLADAAKKKTDTPPVDDKKPAGDKKPTDQKPPDGSAGDEDAELEADLEAKLADVPKLPKNAPQHQVNAVTAMRNKLKEMLKDVRKATKDGEMTVKERDELRTKLDAVGKIDPDDYKNAVDFRRSFAIQDDPEFKAKFDTKIKSHEEDAITLLKGKGFPDSVTEWINAEGGLTQFASSQKLVTDPETGQVLTDSDNKPVTQAEWFRVNVMGHKALTEDMRDEIKDHVREGRKLLREKTKAIEEAKKNGEQWETKVKERMTEQQQQVEREIEETALEEAKSLGVWATLYEPKADATPEQKEAIKVHNERVERGGKMYQDFITDARKSPKGLAKAAVRASLSYYLMDLNSELAEKLKAAVERAEKAEGKLVGYKRAGQVSHRVSAPPNGQLPDAPRKNETDEEAMERTMSEVVDGGTPK